MSQLDQLNLAGQLPSPKGVALAIMNLCGRDETTIDDIARLVSTDPALSGRLLRLANSASSASRPVAAVNEALLRLGMKAVGRLALGFSLVDQYHAGPCTAFDYARFWSHSLLDGHGIERTRANDARHEPRRHVYVRIVGQYRITCARNRISSPVLEATRERLR